MSLPHRDASPSAPPAVQLPCHELLEALDCVGTGVALCDELGIIVYANRIHAAMYGYESPSELLGRHWSMFYEGEDLRRYENEHIPKVMATGHWNGFSMARKKDGSAFEERVWLSRLNAGGIVCFCRDVSEEERIARERDGFFEQNGALAVVASLDGRIVDCNAAFLDFHDSKRENACNRDLADFLGGVALSGVMDALSASGSGATLGFRSGICRGPKKGCAISWTASRIRGSDRVFFIGHDISSTTDAERRMETALAKERELVEMKTQFFALANHELRTPLSVIALVAESLADRRGSLTAERKAQLTSTLLGRVDECRALLDKFMQLDRHFSGRMHFHPRACRPGGLLEEIVDETLLCRSHPRSPDVVLHVAPILNGERLLDNDLFRSVVGNLLQNALNYSPAGSLISIRLDAQGDDVILSVEDAGSGIRPSEAPKLFQPFFRGSNTAGRPGSGVGLTVAKMCANTHGGQLLFSSEHGRGTTFIARLHAPPAPRCAEPRPLAP